MSKFIYDHPNYHIFAKIVITIIVAFVVGYPIYLMDHNFVMTIWGTIIVAGVPMGIMYGLWVDY